VTSLGAKYDLAINDGLRGVGIWTLNYGGGAQELWSLIASRFSRCTGGSVSPTTSSQTAGSTISLTAASTGCAAPRYEFWVQYPDGTWHLQQGWGGAAFNWTTTGLAPGTYTVHAWVNQTGTSWDAIGSATVTLTGCTAASVSPSSTSLSIGSMISFTASSSGCPNPIYEFWVQYPNGSWNLLRGWGGAPFTWNTTGLSPGVYTMHAWANQQGAAPTLEVYGTSTIYTACGSASLTPATATLPAGSTLSLTAASTGCATPRYEFWIQYPDGTWYLKQGWGGAAFNWATTGLVPGKYTVHTWVNQTGTSWDAIGSATVTLTGCTAASASPSSATQLVGSTINVTAGSSGCPNPVYEFWVLYPNGNWVLKQGWGGSTLSWNTAGLGPGTYTVHSWANQQGAAPTLEVYATSEINLGLPCTSGAVTPASGLASAGTALTFIATASGCANPMYEFWLLDPAGTWHLMQAFGYGNTWIWKSAGWAKGTYTIHAWADQVGTDPSTHQAIGSATFTLS
jgi:hypothetical protein